jgi:signal transduction histidine kinase
MVRGDLTQIASNLISNAIDAVSQSGRLEIKASVDDRGTLLEVEDDGSGIPRENQEKVFQPFFTTKPNTGTGLGLWVVKDLVDKQGGTISVTSPTRNRCGTRFSVFLPAPGIKTQKSEVRAS